MNIKIPKTGPDGREHEIMENAIHALQQATDLKVEQRKTKMALEGETLHLRANDQIIEYRVEIKNTLTDIVVGRLSHQFEGENTKWLVVTHYVPHHLARKMRELGIQFIDTVGNVYINKPPILIYIYGNRPPQPLETIPEDRILGRAGLQVIFALLCNKELENATYRDIAHAANVALGTTAGVLRDMTLQGYLLDNGTRGRRLMKKKELVDKWITAYAGRFRSKTLIGRYSSDCFDFWQEVDLHQYDAQWGGEVAAHKMIHYLKPEVIMIYTPRPVNEVVLGLKLRKTDDGKIELREPFWKFEQLGTVEDLAPPLLVYADLLATADARNVKTAKMIYEEYLQGHIGEN